MIKMLQAQLPIEHHFSTNDASIQLQQGFDNLVGEPLCIQKGHTIDLQLQVTTSKGASVLTLVKNDETVAQSSSTLMAS